MFIGHFGAALAAKKIDNKPSLGTLFLASQLIDLIWPIFLIIGIEKVRIDPGNTAFTPLDFMHYPYSHSLLFVFIWSILLGGIYLFIKKNKKSALIIALLVMSHWILDLVTHKPDLPLTSWSDFKVGFGLWNYFSLTIIVESGIFIAGIWMYLIATKSKNIKGIISFWSLILFLSIVYLLNLVTPPPPSEEPIAYVGLSQWLIIAWGYWIDKNRSS